MGRRVDKVRLRPCTYTLDATHPSVVQHMHNDAQRRECAKIAVRLWPLGEVRAEIPSRGGTKHAGWLSAGSLVVQHSAETWVALYEVLFKLWAKSNGGNRGTQKGR